MIKQILYSFTFCMLITSSAFAFDNKSSHPTITLKALEKNIVFDKALKAKFGFEEGLDTNLPNGLTGGRKKHRTITEWLKQGAYEEDEPPCRASNHFHNLLLPWEQA
ncbi:MAG: hypothetical protein GY729_15035 [Desulfobacteraceae bacterium]|nr:hypothetical protein [Desulfobacteraceae bacterium]